MGPQAVGLWTPDQPSREGHSPQEHLDRALERGDVAFQVAVDDEDVGGETWLEATGDLGKATGSRGDRGRAGHRVGDREPALRRVARAMPTMPCGLTGAAPASTPVTSWTPWSRARRSTSRRAAVDVSRSSPSRSSESFRPCGGAGRAAKAARSKPRVGSTKTPASATALEHLVGNADAGVGQAGEVLDPVDARSEGVLDAGEGVGVRQHRKPDRMGRVDDRPEIGGIELHPERVSSPALSSHRWPSP